MWHTVLRARIQRSNIMYCHAIKRKIENRPVAVWRGVRV